MPSSTLIDIESMLRRAFLKSELEFLNTQKRFTTALALAKTSADFSRICALGEDLLKEHHRANPSAQQFRQGSQRDGERPSA
jgi:hypothetical protein